MGKSYWFECGKCGYRAKVAGRADQGLNVAVQTVLCQECKELYDAVTSIRILNGSRPTLQGMFSGAWIDAHAKRAPSLHWALNRLQYPASKLSDWLKYPLQCPIAPIHRIRTWNDPDRCPRCGVYLEKSALAYKIWD